jgi:hypothetical protein
MLRIILSNSDFPEGGEPSASSSSRLRAQARVVLAMRATFLMDDTTMGGWNPGTLYNISSSSSRSSRALVFTDDEINPAIVCILSWRKDSVREQCRVERYSLLTIKSLSVLAVGLECV